MSCDGSELQTAVNNTELSNATVGGENTCFCCISGLEYLIFHWLFMFLLTTRTTCHPLTSPTPAGNW